MITKDDFGPLLVEAVPELGPMWEEATRTWEDSHILRTGVHPADVLHWELTLFVWERLVNEQTALFPAIFRVFERVIAEGEADNDPSADNAYNLIVIGMFEDLQHEIKWSRDGTGDPTSARDRETFTRWLGPASLRAWREEAGVWTKLYDPPRTLLTRDSPTKDASEHVPKRGERIDRVSNRRGKRR